MVVQKPIDKKDCNFQLSVTSSAVFSAVLQSLRGREAKYPLGLTPELSSALCQNGIKSSTHYSLGPGKRKRISDF